MTFNKKPKKFLTKSGFTFLELALVLAVIGTIVGVVIAGQKLTDMAALNGARSATVSSPVSVYDGLVLWLDTTSKKSFDEIEVKAGNTISNWYDINPKKNDPINFTQTTTANKPIYTPKAIGRLPALIFNQNVMNSVNNIPLARIAAESGEVTIFVVGKSDMINGPRFTGFFFFYPSFLDRIGFDMDPTSISWNSGTCCTGRITTDSSVYTNQWAIFTGVRKTDTTEMRIDGASVGGSPTAIPIVEIDPTSKVQIALGTGSQTNKLSGGIAEIIVFNRGLSTTEVSGIETYLSQKWKIKLQ